MILASVDPKFKRGDAGHANFRALNQAVLHGVEAENGGGRIRTYEG
jgi:hypothetical protein